MKVVRYVWVMLVLGLIFGGVVLAQDAPQPAVVCTQDDYLWLQGRLNELSAQFADVATYDPIVTATEMRATLESMQFVCSGVLTDEMYPNGIIGPIAFDGEMYQVTLVTYPDPNATFNSGGIASLEDVSGDCGILNMITTMSTDQDETDIWNMGGDCVGIIEVTGDDWELSFVKIK